MGSSEVGYFPEKKEEKRLSYGEIITRLCPDYLAMGMTLSEYYDGDPNDLVSVREAHALRKKQENFNAWLNGYYVYHALMCASPLFRDWVKDHKPEEYFKEPVDLYPKTQTKEDEQSAEDKKELQNQATIKAWVERANRLLQAKQKEGATNG